MGSGEERQKLGALLAQRGSNASGCPAYAQLEKMIVSLKERLDLT